MTDQETRKKEKPEKTVSEETLSAKEALDSYGASPDYESKYGDAISALADKILRDEGFSYNYSTDPSYMAAREQAEIDRRRAASDAAANAAALTGGYANSYGATAAGEAAAKSYDSLRAMSLKGLTQFARSKRTITRSIATRYLTGRSSAIISLTGMTPRRRATSTATKRRSPTGRTTATTRERCTNTTPTPPIRRAGTPRLTSRRRNSSRLIS